MAEMIISLWGGIKIRDNLTSCSWANLGTGTILTLYCLAVYRYRNLRLNSFFY